MCIRDRSWVFVSKIRFRTWISSLAAQWGVHIAMPATTWNAVSYTHLICNRFLFDLISGSVDFRIIDHTARWIVQDANRLYSGSPDTGTVSYTHLDVYKRQGCTRLGENNVNPKVMQYVMGHSDAQITMNVYNHIAEKSHCLLYTSIFHFCFLRIFLFS